MGRAKLGHGDGRQASSLNARTVRRVLEQVAVRRLVHAQRVEAGAVELGFDDATGTCVQADDLDDEHDNDDDDHDDNNDDDDCESMSCKSVEGSVHARAHMFNSDYGDVW